MPSELTGFTGFTALNQRNLLGTTSTELFQPLIALGGIQRSQESTWRWRSGRSGRLQWTQIF